MKRKFPLAILLGMITIYFTVFTSCETNDHEILVTKTDLLTALPWKRTALMSNPAYDWYGNGTFATDLLSVMKPCEKDNFDTYRNDGTGEVNEGATKCEASDPQTWAYAWTFADNETKLVFDGIDEYTLVELTANTLRFRSSFVENGVTYTHDETYGH